MPTKNIQVIAPICNLQNSLRRADYNGYNVRHAMDFATCNV